MTSVPAYPSEACVSPNVWGLAAATVPRQRTSPTASKLLSGAWCLRPALFMPSSAASYAVGATVGLAGRRLNAAGLALSWYAGEAANLLNRSVLLQEEAPLGTVGKLLMPVEPSGRLAPKTRAREHYGICFIPRRRSLWGLRAGPPRPGATQERGEHGAAGSVCQDSHNAAGAARRGGAAGRNPEETVA